MQFYKKRRKTIILMTLGIVGGILFLWLLPSNNRVRDIVGIVCGFIAMVVGFPSLITWTIAIDDEAVYALYSLFGKVLRIRKKINFKDIRWFTVNDVGWFVVLPFKDSYKYRLREIIIIQPNIQDYKELVNKILQKLDPSIVDERVKMCLAGKFRQAGVSEFFKDIFK